MRLKMKKLFLIIAGICLLSLTGCAVCVETDGHYNSEKYTSKTVSVAAEIENIIVDWDYGSVIVLEHSGDDVTFYETSSKKITDSNKLTYTYNEGTKTLTVDYYNSNQSHSEIVSNKVLVISVPKDKEFNKFKINSNKAGSKISESVKVRIHTLFFCGDIEVNK